VNYDSHRSLNRYVRDLNRLYLREPSLWELDHRPEGFSWIDPNDNKQSITTFMRMSSNPDDFLIIVNNFTSVFHEKYRIGVPFSGEYVEQFNSDAGEYGGTGQLNAGKLKTEKVSWHYQPFSLHIAVPPLATVMFKPVKIIRKLTSQRRERGKKADA
jgi:1,4-alpha-glucan branching enzyme